MKGNYVHVLLLIDCGMERLELCPPRQTSEIALCIHYKLICSLSLSPVIVKVQVQLGKEFIFVPDNS